MTLFERIKQTKKLDYKQAYKQALANSISQKQHADTVTLYSVTGEFLTFKKELLLS